MKVPRLQEAESVSIYDLQNCKPPFRHGLKLYINKLEENRLDWHLIREKTATHQPSNRNIRESMNMELLQPHITSWVRQVFGLECLINLFYIKKNSVVRGKEQKKLNFKQQKLRHFPMFLISYQDFELVQTKSCNGSFHLLDLQL